MHTLNKPRCLTEPTIPSWVLHPTHKPWVKPVPSAPKALSPPAATPSAKVEPGATGKSAGLPPAALVSGTAYTSDGEPVAQVLYSQTSLSDMASKFDMCHSKTVTTPKREHRSECAEAAQREGRAHEKLLGNIMTNLTVCRMSVIFCGSLSGRCLA